MEADGCDTAGTLPELICIQVCRVAANLFTNLCEGVD
jgi:hypothetical protein